MVDPNDYLSRPLYARVAHLRRVTFMMLCAERAGRAFLPFATWLCFFIGLWLTGVTQSLPAWAQQAISFAAITGAFFFILRGARRFTWPGKDETDRRLQEQSGVKHRPLSALDDTLPRDVGDDTRTLWDKSRHAIPDAIAKLRPALPRPVLAAADPRALRFLAVLTLITGIVMAGDTGDARVRTGLWPFSVSPIGIGSGDIATLTITPPAYTGRDTVIIKGVAAADAPPVEIAEGSTIKAHVTGGFGTPVLRMDDNEQTLDTLGDKSFRIETAALPGHTLSITQMFGPRVKFPYVIVPDEEPGIALAGNITVMPRGEIRIPLILRDDYRVRDLQMRLDIDPSIMPLPRIGKFYDEIRAVMTKGGEDVKIQPVYDLTFHPWAGLPVKITFLATDDKGQGAVLKPITFTLPERSFTNPAAAHIAGVRKRILADPDGDAKAIQDGLVAVAERPSLYGGDLHVYLALVSAIYRLQYAPGFDTAAGLVPLLWDVAMTIEDGQSGKALRDLQEARENLEAALDDPNATEQQIAALVQKFQEAMQRYFQEMAQSMQRQQQQGQQPMIPPEMLAQMITPQDLAAFFAQLQAQAISGDRDAAREMLSRMSQFMDGVSPSMNAQMPQDVMDMAEAMSKLQEIIDRQRDLLDDTRGQEQAQTAPPQEPSPFPSTGDPVLDDILAKLQENLNRERTVQRQEQQRQRQQQQSEQNRNAMAQTQKGQEELRRQLGGVMQDVGEKLNDIPENMGAAEQEMRGAASSLKEQQPGQAVGHQERALEELQKAKDQMEQKLSQRLSQMTGMAMGGQGRRDPLGRPYGDGDGTNPLLGEKVKIPDESDRKKIDDILKTLRHKSGDMTRPEEELDYFRRLLKQF